MADPIFAPGHLLEHLEDGEPRRYRPGRPGQQAETGTWFGQIPCCTGQAMEPGPLQGGIGFRQPMIESSIIGAWWRSRLTGERQAIWVAAGSSQTGGQCERTTPEMGLGHGAVEAAELEFILTANRQRDGIDPGAEFQHAVGNTVAECIQ